jgi:hypothetical protein
VLAGRPERARRFSMENMEIMKLTPDKKVTTIFYFFSGFDLEQISSQLRMRIGFWGYSYRYRYIEVIPAKGRSQVATPTVQSLDHSANLSHKIF